MSKMDQAKLLMKARKLQKELQNEIIEVEAGEGAVKVEIKGEQKIKKILFSCKINMDIVFRG